MLKKTFAKCPRQRGCAGTPKQGQGRGPPNPTHTPQSPCHFSIGSRVSRLEKQAPGPPPISILGQFLFRPNGWGARSRGAELAHLEAGRPGQLDIRRTTSVHAGNAASRMQTKARACQQNFCRASSQAASTCTEKRARACRGASNACYVAVRQPESSRRASVVQGGVCVGSKQTGSTSLFYL